MKTLLLDTNFLLLPQSHGIDIFEELESIVEEAHETVTLSTVVKELENLVSSGGEKSVSASIGLQLLKEKSVKIVDSEGPVDSAVAEYASGRRDVIVCTNDRELKKKLRDNGAEVVCLRSNQRLMRC